MDSAARGYAGAINPPPVPDELDDIWAAISAQLQRAVGDSTYGIWLEPLTPVELDGEVLVVAAPDEARGWIADRFARVLRRRPRPCSAPA